MMIVAGPVARGPRHICDSDRPATQPTHRDQRATASNHVDGLVFREHRSAGDYTDERTASSREVFGGADGREKKDRREEGKEVIGAAGDVDVEDEDGREKK
jgi:hypothetical protein